MYKVLDLFCWIWWFSRWFSYEWFKIVAWIDFRDIALQTFKTLHKESESVLEDLTNLWENYWEQYKGIDVIIAWPPCQGFSMAWKREIWDNRNTLFWEVIKAAKVISPQVVVIENVVGLVSMRNKDNKLIKDIIEEELLKLWYKTQYKILDASEYWVPQKRKRVIFVWTKKEGFKYPQKSKKIVSVGDALSNIPDSWRKKYLKPKNDFQKLMAKDNKENIIYNHDIIEHKELIVKRMASVPQWWNWKDIPIALWQWWWKHSNNYRRLDYSHPSITLKHATKSMIIHPIYNRWITPREVARLQSFSDDCVLKWTKFQQHQQLANAVPPLLWKAIAKSVKLYLNKQKNEI